MKTGKRILILILFSLLFMFFPKTDILTLSAASAKDQTGKSSWNPTSEIEENIYGMSHIVTNGNAVTGNEAHYQNINVFQMKTDGYSSKLVTWAVMNSSSTYKRTTISQAARDYQINHPGWIVLGGINADQYFFTFGNKIGIDGSYYVQPTPYYPMVTSGDKVFTTSPTGNSTSAIGFLNNGKTDSFAHSTGAGGYVLEILDINNNVLAKFNVDGINKKAEANETTVWSPHFSDVSINIQVPQEVTSTTPVYVIGDAEMQFMSNYSGYTLVGAKGQDQFFGKGTITKENATNVTLSGGSFAIESMNSEVNQALKVGVRVRVQQEFKDEVMNSAEEVVGYHAAHIVGGIDQEAKGSYDTNQYSRSLFGKKADGTYVLITADMVSAYKTKGLNWTECNAVAAYYGLDEMYQMDGGGSVTAMTRQPNGSFLVTNVPKDSGDPSKPREDYSYLFFVVRDPGVRVNEDATTYHSFSLEKLTTVNNSNIKNIVVEVNGKKYNYDKDTLTIDGLDKMTTYPIKIYYDIESDGNVSHATFDMEITTKEYSFPEKPFQVTDIRKNSITISKPETDLSKNIKNVVVHLGDRAYSMNEESTFNIDDLIDDTTYELFYSYDIYDEVTKKTYSTTTEKTNVKTLSYEIPLIKKFIETKKTATTITIEYLYEDLDNVVTKAYLLINNEQKEVTTKIGYEKIALDFENQDNIIQLVVEYTTENGTIKQIKSDQLFYEKTASTPVEKDPTEETLPKKKCGKKDTALLLSLLTSASFLGLVLLKKHE